MHARRTVRQSDSVCWVSFSGIRRAFLGSCCGFPLTSNRAETGRWLSPSIKIFLVD